MNRLMHNPEHGASCAVPLRAGFAALAAALILAGCAAGGAGSSSPDGSALPQAGSGRDPLLDAPYHSETTCVTERAVTVASRMSDTPFACRDLGVSATLSELRDAGWRVVSLDIGPDSESEKHVGFPVTIMIRKLF